jgi:radical SAM superfamily enzyme YgiQ (UPF0313 family)
MMKVMLVEANFPRMHGYEVIFPFGYACLGAVLQREGHEVEYVFPTASNLSMQHVVNYISNADANLIGIGGLLPYLPTVIKLVRMIKAVRQDIPIILGGQMVTYTPELALRMTSADFGIAGEGEIALLKLVDCLENGKDYSEIPGLVFKRDERVISNGMGEIMPLEDIPLPNWDDFPMDYYFYAGSRAPVLSANTGPKRVFTWVLSRGCPMKCNFCASGSEPRYKTITQSMSELQEIVDRFDPDYITFVDNLFTPNKNYTIDLCEAFIASGFRFEFSVASRANLVDPELLRILRRAGCRAVFYGLECANDNILRFINKGITTDQMIRAIEMTKEADIYPMVSIMFGQPGETFDDFFNSLRIALNSINPKKPVPNMASVMPLLTFPGTGIYGYAKQQGYFAGDADYWNKYKGSHQIHYANDYTKEAVGEVWDIANTIFRWKYHQSMADNLLESLRYRRSSYSGSRGRLTIPDREHLRMFLDRCLDMVVDQQSGKRKKRAPSL